MILLGAVLGIVLGLALGGRLDSLINVRLRFALLIFMALAVRFGTQIAIASGAELVDAARLPLYATAFGVLAAALWLNRRHPGLSLVAAGVAANGIAVVANGGWMPVYLPALAAAGISPAELSPTFHVALPDELGLEFLLRAGPLGDIVPIPFAVLGNVISLGDVLISIGLGWFVFATLLRGEPYPEQAGVTLWRGDSGSTAAMDRPMVLGGGMGGGLPTTAGPGSAGGPGSAQAAGGEAGELPDIYLPPAPIGARIRAHPYVRLARDARFSAFWLAQTISFFGDRLHQVALGVLVLAVTNSALATGLVFLAASLPNLLLGPIAGTFVDRWDHKRVLVVSDLLRAGLVLLVPAAVSVDIVLVYPIVFAVTAVSIFFRPAKAVVVPRIVDPDDLLAANSATWTGETIADIGGYPLAGLFVALLGGELALAFWVDAATYVVSALLIVGITIPPVARAAVPRAAGAIRTFLAELREGWHVLRRQPVLFQNTLVSTVAQLSVGATLALHVVYARDALDGRFIAYPYSYAAIDTAIGVGNLIGGLAVGIVGARLGKGRMVVAGFLAMGVATVALGLTSNVLIALTAATVTGIANLVYIIPSQTLFAQLTPEGYMGRVVAFRSTLVFGAMTASMAVFGALAEVMPVGTVIALSGVITVGAALAAWLLPAVRDA